MSRDWRQYPQIFSIGKIEPMGDLYYDGIVDAHNREFYIRWQDDIYAEGMYSHECERLYFAYKMDSVLSALIEQKHQTLNAYMTARHYAKTYLTPHGIILERHLDRTRNA